MKLKWLGVFLVVAAQLTGYCASVYVHRPDDKAAVYLTKDRFEVHADGVGDDSAALQRAIDQVQSTSGQGIVFVPEGRYRISRTIYVWPGVRVIGYGAQRPVLTLGAHTAGFRDGIGYMVFFAGRRASAGQSGSGSTRADSTEIFPGTVPSAVVNDANPGTFYSAMSNIDFDIGEGNPGAVGIRFHAAQHCFLAHMDFRIGSGMAALKDVGNEAEDLHFYGGQYGIVTSKPSPGWQFTLLDSSFEGQREAAIREHEAGLTLVGDVFRNVPTAVSIDQGYAEELWVQRTRFEHISGPAIVISNEANQRTQIALREVLCSGVPVLAKFRESGKQVAGPAATYAVKEFSHGLRVQIGGASAIRTEVKLSLLAQLPALPPPVIAALPESASWVNLRTLGAKGDGVSDDTEAIETAIAGHQAIYIPSGRYRVTRTITLKPDTVLIGLHPSTTQFDVADRTAGFDGPGGPVPLLRTLPGSSNIVVGLGLDAGGINSRAVGAMWRSGSASLMDDVRFLGGHGTNNPDGSRMNPYNGTHTADPDPMRRWDGEYPSLWVLDGGGGTFANIWTPDTFAQAGLYVSNTSTPGHVYELSSEHHVRTEVKLSHAANWELVALQTEEEHGEGAFALPLEIDACKDILIANMHSYRVVGSAQTFPYAVRVAHSQNIRFRNLHMDSDSKVSFDSSVFDEDRGDSVRDRELQSLDIGAGGTESRAGTNARTPRRPGVVVKRLATGFFNIAGATVDGDGRLYFVDSKWQKICRWSAAGGVEIVRDSPLDAVNLAVDRAGNLLVVSYAGKGTVYSFNPAGAVDELTVLKPQPAAADTEAHPAVHAGMDAFLPVDRWALRGSLDDPTLLRREFAYVSPDGSTFIPAGRDFVEGALYYGTKMSDVLRSFALAKASAGRAFYVTDEEEQKTYSGTVGIDGTLQGLRLFAERGGESVTQGPDGKVYIAAGQIYVYTPAGKLVDTIEVPERPIDLIFGGKDQETLFILARTSLYATKIGGR